MSAWYFVVANTTSVFAVYSIQYFLVSPLYNLTSNVFTDNDGSNHNGMSGFSSIFSVPIASSIAVITAQNWNGVSTGICDIFLPCAS